MGRENILENTLRGEQIRMGTEIQSSKTASLEENCSKKSNGLRKLRFREKVSGFILWLGLYPVHKFWSKERVNATKSWQKTLIVFLFWITKIYIFIQRKSKCLKILTEDLNFLFFCYIKLILLFFFCFGENHCRSGSQNSQLIWNHLNNGNISFIQK